MASVDARDLATTLIFDAIDDPSLLDRFPDGSYFIASDDPHFDALVREGRAEGCPVVVLFPGRQYLILDAEAEAEGAPGRLAGELHLCTP
jgi:hypothetical protein